MNKLSPGIKTIMEAQTEYNAGKSDHYPQDHSETGDWLTWIFDLSERGILRL